MVHFVLPTFSLNCGQHRPAIVSEVMEGGMTVKLVVFKGHTSDLMMDMGVPVPGCVSGGKGDAATGLMQGIPYAENGVPGSWHWPEVDPEDLLA